MASSNFASLTVPVCTSAWSDLAQVEQQLRACPAVLDALVTRRADRPAGRDLVAYLRTAPGAAISPGAIRDHVANALAPRWMPSTFITLDDFPMLEDGAIDRAALPPPDSAMLGLRQYEAPHGPVEKAIATLWSDLLGVDQIGRQAHFFELGGHSALAVQLVYRLRQQMEVDIAMRELFQAPVLHMFAAAVSTRIRLARFPHGPAHGAVPALVPAAA
jgi:aryl carrier-like protein